MFAVVVSKYFLMCVFCYNECALPVIIIKGKTLQSLTICHASWSVWFNYNWITFGTFVQVLHTAVNFQHVWGGYWLTDLQSPAFERERFLSGSPSMSNRSRLAAGTYAGKLERELFPRALKRNSASHYYRKIYLHVWCGVSTVHVPLRESLAIDAVSMLHYIILFSVRDIYGAHTWLSHYVRIDTPLCYQGRRKFSSFGGHN